MHIPPLKHIPALQNYRIVQEGMIGALHYELCSDFSASDIHHALFCYTAGSTNPCVIVTIEKQPQGSACLMILLIDEGPMARVYFGKDDLQSFFVHAQAEVQTYCQHFEVAKKHIKTIDYYPQLDASQIIESGEVGSYRYEIHINCISRGLIQYKYVVFWFSLSEDQPCYVVAAEVNASEGGEYFLGEFTQHGHRNYGSKATYGELTFFLKQAQKKAEQYLPLETAWQPNVHKTEVPLSHDAITTIIAMDHLYVLAVVTWVSSVLALLLFGFADVSYVGWLFQALWYVCWFVSAYIWVRTLRFLTNAHLFRWFLFLPVLAPWLVPFGKMWYVCSYFLIIVLLRHKLQGIGLQLGWMGLSIEDEEMLKKQLHDQDDLSVSGIDLEPLQGDDS